MICPPKSSPQWKEFASRFDDSRHAELAWIREGARMPHPDTARQLLGMPLERSDVYPEGRRKGKLVRRGVTDEQGQAAKLKAMQTLGLKSGQVHLMSTPEELEALKAEHPDEAAKLASGSIAFAKDGNMYAYLPHVEVLEGDASPVDSLYHILAHETFHNGEQWVKEHAPELHAKLKAMRSRVSDSELEHMAQRYTWAKDWKTSPERRAELASEWLARELRGAHEAPKEGLIAELVQWLKDVWAKMFGSDKPPHLQELKQLFDAMVAGMRRSPDKAGATSPTRFALGTGTKPMSVEGYTKRREDWYAYVRPRETPPPKDKWDERKEALFNHFVPSKDLQEALKLFGGSPPDSAHARLAKLVRNALEGKYEESPDLQQKRSPEYKAYRDYRLSKGDVDTHAAPGIYDENYKGHSLLYDAIATARGVHQLEQFPESISKMTGGPLREYVGQHPEAATMQFLNGNGIDFKDIILRGDHAELKNSQRWHQWDMKVREPMHLTATSGPFSEAMKVSELFHIQDKYAGVSVPMVAHLGDIASRLDHSMISTTGGGRTGDMTGFKTWPRTGFGWKIDKRANERWIQKLEGEPGMEDLVAKLKAGQIKSSLELFADRGFERWYSQNGRQRDMAFDLRPDSQSWLALARLSDKLTPWLQKNPNSPASKSMSSFWNSEKPRAFLKTKSMDSVRTQPDLEPSTESKVPPPQETKSKSKFAQPEEGSDEWWEKKIREAEKPKEQAKKEPMASDLKGIYDQQAKASSSTMVDVRDTWKAYKQANPDATKEQFVAKMEQLAKDGKILTEPLENQFDLSAEDQATLIPQRFGMGAFWKPAGESRFAQPEEEDLKDAPADLLAFNQVLGKNTEDQHVIQRLKPMVGFARRWLGSEDGDVLPVTAANTAKVKEMLDEWLHNGEEFASTWRSNFQEETGLSGEAVGSVLQLEMMDYAKRLAAQGDTSLARKMWKTANDLILSNYLTMASAARNLQTRSNAVGEGSFWKALKVEQQGREQAAVKDLGAKKAEELKGVENKPLPAEAPAEIVATPEGKAIEEELQSSTPETERRAEEYSHEDWWARGKEQLDSHARGLADSLEEELRRIDLITQELASLAAGKPGGKFALSGEEIANELKGKTREELQAMLEASKARAKDLLEGLAGAGKAGAKVSAKTVAKAKKSLVDKEAQAIIKRVESLDTSKIKKAESPLKRLYTDQITDPRSLDEFLTDAKKQGLDTKTAAALFDAADKQRGRADTKEAIKDAVNLRKEQQANRVSHESRVADLEKEQTKADEKETSAAVKEARNLIKEQKARKAAHEREEAEKQREIDREDKKSTEEAFREAKRLRKEQESRRIAFEREEATAKAKVDKLLKEDAERPTKEAQAIIDRIDEQHTEWLPKEPAKRSEVKTIEQLGIKDERVGQPNMSRNRFIDEYQGRLESAGVDPAASRAMASRLYDENVRINAPRETGARERIVSRGTLQSLMEGIRNAPLALQRDPEWRKAQMVEYFQRNGMTRERALKAADWAAGKVNDLMEKARLKDAKAFNDSLPEGKRLKVEDLQRAIRNGVLDPSKNLTDMYAQRMGFKSLDQASYQKLADIDEKLSKTVLPTDRAKLLLDMGHILEKTGMPKSDFQVLYQGYVNSVLSGLSTVGLHYTQPFFSQAIRLGTEITDIMSEARRRPLGEVTDMLKATMGNWLSAYKGYLDTVRVALTKDVMSRKQVRNLDQMSSLHQTMQDALDGIKTRKGGPLGMVRNLWRFSAASTDFAHRALLTGVEAGGRTMEDFLTRQESMKALVRKAGMKFQDNEGLTIGAITEQAQLAGDRLTQERIDALGPDATHGDMALARQAGRDETLRYMREAVAAATGEAGDAESIRQYAEQEANYELGLRGREKGGKYDLFHFLTEFAVDAARLSREKNPLLGRLITGFVSVPARLMDRSLSFTPYGLARAIAKTAELKKGNNDLYLESMGSARQIRQRLIEGGIGTAALSILVPLVYGQEKQDDPHYTGFRVTLAGPKAQGLKDAWKKAGNRPGSIEWVQDGKVRAAINYARGGPESVKTALIALGTLDDMRLNGHLQNKDVIENAGEYLKEGLSGGLKEASFFGLKNLASLPAMTEQSDKSVASNLAYMGSGAIPWSGFVRSMAKLASGPMDNSSVRSALAAQVPFASSLGHPALNFLGDPVNAAPSDPFTAASDRLSYAGLPLYLGIDPKSANSELYDLMLKQGHTPTAPSRSALARKNGAVSDTKWESFVRTRGKLIKDGMRGEMAELRRMQPADFEKAVTRIAADAQKETKEQLNLR